MLRGIARVQVEGSSRSGSVCGLSATGAEQELAVGFTEQLGNELRRSAKNEDF